MGQRSGLTLAEFAASYPREYAAWVAEDASLRVRGGGVDRAGARPRRPGAPRLPRRAGAGPDRHRGAPRRLPEGRPDGTPRLAVGAVRLAPGTRELRLQRAVRARASAAASGSRRTTRRRSAPGTDPISQPTGPLARIPRVACRTGGQRFRGCGAAGSASAWHAEGQGFESPQLHRTRWSEACGSDHSIPMQGRTPRNPPHIGRPSTNRRWGWTASAQVSDISARHPRTRSPDPGSPLGDSKPRGGGGRWMVWRHPARAGRSYTTPLDATGAHIWGSFSTSSKVSPHR